MQPPACEARLFCGKRLFHFRTIRTAMPKFLFAFSAFITTVLLLAACCGQSNQTRYDSLAVRVLSGNEHETGEAVSLPTESLALLVVFELQVELAQAGFLPVAHALRCEETHEIQDNVVTFRIITLDSINPRFGANSDVSAYFQEGRVGPSGIRFQPLEAVVDDMNSPQDAPETQFRLEPVGDFAPAVPVRLVVETVFASGISFRDTTARLTLL